MNRKRHNARGVVPPPGIIGLAVFGLVAFFGLPLIGLLWRVPWASVTDVLATSSAREALRVSLICSLSATLLSVLFGIPIAWMLSRIEFRAGALVRSLAILPLVLPPVVGGVALFYAFGRRGIVGQWIDRWFGIQLPFTIWAAIIAETFVAMPFFVVTVEGALRALDVRYEEAAAIFGAKRWTIMRRVTLPMIGPSLAAGVALTWARALGEFGATITFAGNFSGRTQTLPLSIYLAFENNEPAGLVLSMVLLVVSLIVLTLVGSRVLTSRGVIKGAP